jgi:hypothetical protein
MCSHFFPAGCIGCFVVFIVAAAILLLVCWLVKRRFCGGYTGCCCGPRSTADKDKQDNV